MFNPDTAGPHTTWTADAACFSCSFWMDNFNGLTVHLNHRDITTPMLPSKGASEARCRELCGLHGPLPFNLMRSAVLAGARHALSCLGCTAALMVALVLIGMANLVWVIGLTAIVLLYKLAPTATPLRRLVLSGGLVAAGVAYGIAA